MRGHTTSGLSLNTNLQTPLEEQEGRSVVDPDRLQQSQDPSIAACQPATQLPRSLKRPAAVLREALLEEPTAADVAAESLSRACSTAPAIDKVEGALSSWQVH